MKRGESSSMPNGSSARSACAEPATRIVAHSAHEKFETLMMIPRSLPSPGQSLRTGLGRAHPMNGGAGVVHKCIRCSWEAPRAVRRLRWLQPGFLTPGVIMHSHSFRTRRYRLAAAALLLLSGVSAQACEIWRDEELGIWRGNCKLKDFLVPQTFLAHLPAPADLQVAGPAHPQVRLLHQRHVRSRSTRTCRTSAWATRSRARSLST